MPQGSAPSRAAEAEENGAAFAEAAPKALAEKERKAEEGEVEGDVLLDLLDATAERKPAALRISEGEKGPVERDG